MFFLPAARAQQAFTPVAVLLISFAFKLKTMNATLLGIVFAISFGVAIASYGEVSFAFDGFVCQVLAIAFESSRLVMIQVLLQGLKMDPLVSLYYFAPVCAAINACLLPFREGFAPFIELGRLGPMVLLSNASVAFALNIAAVFLIGAASSLVSAPFHNLKRARARARASSKALTTNLPFPLSPLLQVLTLAGVVKDILLIMGSMLLLGSTVTGLQFFGYAIALAGLVAFKTHKA